MTVPGEVPTAGREAGKAKSRAGKARDKPTRSQMHRNKLKERIREPLLGFHPRRLCPRGAFAVPHLAGPPGLCCCPLDISAMGLLECDFSTESHVASAATYDEADGSCAHREHDR